MSARNDRFLRACRQEPVDRTPVWFMRQAGRYLPEYRALRAQHDFLTLSRTPDLAIQVTLLPLRRFPVDAAILFADILLPLMEMGADLHYVKADGPVIRNPVRDSAGVESLHPIDPSEDLPYVLEAIRGVRGELDEAVPLIGFAGAPFTLASYLIEGGPSKDFVQTKSLMYREPNVWRDLMTKLVAMTAEYLRAQIRAGAQAVQLFDSWAGCLSPGDYREYVLPYSRQVFQALRPEGVPLIHFGTGTSALLESMATAGGDAIGLDWRIELDVAWDRLGPSIAVQGNLDPAALFGPIPEIKSRAEDILRRAGNRPGHIFNLGHGILPGTPPDHVAALVEFVHRASER
ncbi:MAG: uroporphyrinogen decarboxylase [Anaerolineae bacterium]